MKEPKIIKMVPIISKDISKNTEKKEKIAEIIDLFWDNLSYMKNNIENRLSSLEQCKWFKIEHKKEHLFITNIYNNQKEPYEIMVKRKWDFWKINVTNVTHKEEYFYESSTILEKDMKDEINYVLEIIYNDFLNPKSKLKKEDLLNINLDDWI